MDWLSEWIGTLSRGLNIDRSDAATLIAVAFATALSLAATVASWFAVLATFASVREMRAARLDSQKPMLVPHRMQTWQFVWDRTDNSQHYETKDKSEAVRTSQTPLLSFHNAGVGSAIDFQISISKLKEPYGDTSDISHLRRVFDAAGISVKRSKHGVSFYEDDDEFLRWYFDSGVSGTFSEIALPGKQFEIPVPSHLIQSYLIKAISEDQDHSSKNMAWILPVKVAYRTGAGQKIEDKYGLVISSGGMGLIVGDPPVVRNGVPNWSKLNVDLSIYLTANWKGQKFTSLAKSSILWFIDQHLDRFNELFENVDRKLAVWTFLKGKRHFRIGDRVVRSVDTAWNVDDDEEPITPMEGTSWQLADAKERRKRKKDDLAD